MDYKEKYEMALEGIQEILSSGQDSIKMSRLQLRLQGIFPELKESEDDRIRKELIEQVVYIAPNNDEIDSECNVLPTYQKRIDKYRAWLEKQGEQKQEPLTKEKALKKSPFIVQKPVDKVELKFKIEKGKWYVGIKTLALRGKLLIKENNIYYAREDGAVIGENEALFIDRLDGNASEFLKLWTIQDAKDGDVLANNGNIILFKDISNSARKDYKYIKSHCLVLIHSLNFYTGGSYNLDDGFHPATKKQCELLFQKMHEAGYEWDAEKKKLEKIKPSEWHREDEQNLNACLGYIQDEFLRRWLTDVIHVKYDKPAEWSEEDEKILKDIITDVKFEGYNNDMLANSYKKIKWLKSLKDRVQPQNTWKPSDEQMEVLEFISDYHCFAKKNNQDIFKEFVKQLKKLREE